MKPLAVVRGAGDLATGVGRRLHLCGFAVVHLEVPDPTVVRRSVAFASAVYQGEIEVEGVMARLAHGAGEVPAVLGAGAVAVLVDPEGATIPALHPAVVVDATMRKGKPSAHAPTRRGMAPCTVALGPGFEAGSDVDLVVETCRGHHLGRVLSRGRALPPTGVPGEVGGAGAERVLRATAAGVFRPTADIGEAVAPGQVVAEVDGKTITSPIGGVLRGLLHAGLSVVEGQKVGDVDPRGDRELCFTISEKSNAVAGGVLEAVFRGLGRWVFIESRHLEGTDHLGPVP